MANTENTLEHRTLGNENQSPSVSLEPDNSKNTENTLDIRARGWFLTVWHHTDEELMMKLRFVNGKKLIGSESAPTTGGHHQHVYLYGRNAFKWSYLVGLIGKGNGKVEVAKGSPKQNLKYLSKVNLIWNDWPELMEEDHTYKGQDLPKEENLYPWERSLIEIISAPKIEDRQIIWICTEEGGYGKSRFGKYLEFHNKNICYTRINKNADIITAVEQKYNTYYFDFPRTLEDYFNGYHALECILDGVVDDCKLKKTPRKLRFNPPWVVVVANFLPETEKLSQDRWKLMTIDNKFELIDI